MSCTIRQSFSQPKVGAALDVGCTIGTDGAGGLRKKLRVTAPKAQIVKKVTLRAIGPRFLMRVSLSLHLLRSEGSAQYGATDARGKSRSPMQTRCRDCLDERVATRQRVPTKALIGVARLKTCRFACARRRHTRLDRRHKESPEGSVCPPSRCPWPGTAIGPLAEQSRRNALDPLQYPRQAERTRTADLATALVCRASDRRLFPTQDCSQSRRVFSGSGRQERLCDRPHRRGAWLRPS
jgi:hypothetical protein